MVNDELVDLAQTTQRRHRDLIAQAATLKTTEERRPIRDQLDLLKEEFTHQALFLTNTISPDQWFPENPDHAVAIAVRNDIADTESRLALLAYGQVLQKQIGEMWKPPKLPDLVDKTSWLILLGAALVAFAILSK